ncbi:hypothetical protein IFM89_037242 [Coptis chinensis]|uniref:Uncharacterized protein n=1 Tax=Coptis chinensis TaxID=261450 RepID=A0A835HBD4_9MAGN|nr:hypothetical protein IFM89_037242 [Coptis chinensis]
MHQRLYADGHLLALRHTTSLLIFHAFGTSWKEGLVEGKLLEGTVDPGNPTIFVISASAIRSLCFSVEKFHLLIYARGLRSLTVDCRAAKLFAKHMKVEDQVSMLKSRVNIASGTPNRRTGEVTKLEGHMETSEEEWVTVYSPSTTAAALAKLRYINCLNYLR